MNILLISTIYPIPGPNNYGTSVCHYFARNWSELGYNVQVVHIQAVYPRPMYWAAKMARNWIAAKTGAVVYTSRDKGGSYVMDGISVIRIPVFKPIPHGRCSRKSVKSAVCSIIFNNQKRNFCPDYIIAHFPNPQLEIIDSLKAYYPCAKTALVMHGDSEMTKKVYGKDLIRLLGSVDAWGFRNLHDRDVFMQVIAPVKRTFMCYSGVPEYYLADLNRHDYSRPLKEFIYVGEMIERKYPEVLIDALQEAYPSGGWHLTYVGDGQQINKIRERVAKCHIEESVTILGQVPRDEILALYDAADCMMMISRGEAYGLVYLEAMARGCITIASRDEGFDGVIIDGENGFLCKAGAPEELARIIIRINSMPANDRQRISDAALDSARNLTDLNAAKRYIESVMSVAK